MATYCPASGNQGRAFSSWLQGIKTSLKSLNQTVAEEMISLQHRDTDTATKLTQGEGTVKKLKEESDGAGPEACCPRDWAAFRKSCYWDSGVRKTWEEAKAECKVRNAHLVIINSFEEQLFVASHAGLQSTWIGLTDSSGSWEWVDGMTETVREEEWCSDQPDNWYGHGLGGGEDCAHITTRSCWNDDHCTRLYGWICEMEIIE